MKTHEITDYSRGMNNIIYRLFESEQDAKAWLAVQPDNVRRECTYIYREWFPNFYNRCASRGQIRVMKIVVGVAGGIAWDEEVPYVQAEMDLRSTPAALAHREAARFADSAATELKKAQEAPQAVKKPEPGRPKINRFKEAIGVQNAGNLRGIARSFVEVCDDAMYELQATTAVWRDPAVILFAAKIAELTGCGLCNDEVYSKAYRVCREKAGLETKEHV